MFRKSLVFLFLFVQSFAAESVIFSDVGWLFLAPGENFEKNEFSKAEFKGRKVERRQERFYGHPTKYYRVEEDFLAHIGDKFSGPTFQEQEGVYAYLSAMMEQPKVNTKVYYSGLQLIMQTKLLTDREKMRWLEENVYQLMPPYMVYLAILKAQSSFIEGKSWFQAAMTWTQEEMKYCEDPSVKAALDVLSGWFAKEVAIVHLKNHPEQLFTVDMGGKSMKYSGNELVTHGHLYYAPADRVYLFRFFESVYREVSEDNYKYQNKMKKNAAQIFKRAKISKRPYWLASHGRAAFETKIGEHSFD